EPGSRLLGAPVLGESAGQLLRSLLGLELEQRRRLGREEPAGRQLQQRRHEDEELAARLEIELAALREPLAEGDHDPRHVDLGEVELLLQDQRQQQVERTLERVEVELELPYLHRRQPSVRAGRGPSESPLPVPPAYAVVHALAPARRLGGTATRRRTP